MGSQHQTRLPIPIARIWIDAAREQISHDVGFAPPNGIFPTDIHSTDSPRANIFVFEPSAESYKDLAIVPTLEWKGKGDFGHLPDTRKDVHNSVIGQKESEGYHVVRI
jgi:hypothetical protein